MPHLELSGASFAHSDANPLLRDVSIRLDPGWTGVVGANGSGKTTLLRLLAGQLDPEAGRVLQSPAGLRVHVCPQAVEVRGTEVEVLAGASDRLASRLRGQLGLEPGDLARWPSLSPGERKRWQVGAALQGEPHALLLDEPTNHLDAEARGQLFAALQGYVGIGLLVSHDRWLLDALTTRTLRFGGGELRTWRGGYSVARGGWQAEEAAELDAYQKLQAQRRRTRRRLADARQKRAQAAAKMRREMRCASPKDIDTRKRLSWTRRRSAEARFGRETHKLRAQLGRQDRASGAFELSKALGRELFVDWEPAPVSELLCARGDLVVAGRLLAAELDARVGRTARIRVTGPNGAGKSTLLRGLLAGARVPAERLLYLPQELSVSEEDALLAELRAAPAEEQGRVLAIVAALGVDPDGLLASVRPSPGEARKLALALGLGRCVWGLVLDEPTNHLDLPSIERLEEALAAHPGALVLVSHDEAFGRSLADSVWSLGDGRLRLASP